MVGLAFRRALGRFVIFGLLGLLLEVFFTAAGKLASGHWSMHGHSSPWMMLDYGLLGLFLMPVSRPLIRCGIPLPARALVYMLAIFAVEYISGTIFTRCGLRIWDYSHLPFHLHGQITLLCAPAWYALGLVAEYVYRKVDAISVLLSLGIRAEQLEASNKSQM